MFNSLWTKFLLLLVGISAIALSSALVLREFMVDDFKKYLEGEMEDRIYWVSADLERIYEKYSGWREDVIMEDVVWALMMGLDVRVRDGNDKIIADSEKALNSLTPLVKRRLDAILKEKAPEPESSFQPYPLFLAGKEIGSLEVRFLKPRKEAVFIARSNKLLLSSVFVIGAVAILLSIFFSKRLTDPIKSLSSAAEAIIEGNLKQRVTVSGGDEIGRLSETYNKMAQRLEAQEDLRKKLISNIAHELRTPLGAMRSEMEGMMDDVIPLDKEQVRSLYEETGRLRKILDGIEDLAQAEASAMTLEKQRIDLKPFLSHIIDRFEKLFLDKGVAVGAEGPAIMIEADPERLSQVVINLLNNALKATDRGGKVWVKTGRRGAEAFIEVSDTGTGIRQEDLPFIFERFHRIAEGGLGLGLTITRELVEAHGGRMEVRSEYGKGSYFTVFLPPDDVHNSS